MKKTNREIKGIDWSKKDIYEGIGRPDLRPKNWKCPYCDFVVPSWLFHKKQSLAKHISYRHPEHSYKTWFKREEVKLLIKSELEKFVKAVCNEYLYADEYLPKALEKYLKKTDLISLKDKADIESFELGAIRGIRDAITILEEEIKKRRFETPSLIKEGKKNEDNKTNI